jgi:hypothetical protein
LEVAAMAEELRRQTRRFQQQQEEAEFRHQEAIQE